MAPSLVASYYVQISPQGTSTLTTPSFTPSNGEVLVVKLVTWDSGSPLGAPTGGSQTYTSRIVNAPGGFNEYAAIYTAVISGSPGSMTVSSTPSVSLRGSMLVERWSGAQLAATPVTASSNSFSAPASGSITPSSGTSIISWAAGDAQSIDPSTRTYLGSATDEGVRDDHVGSNGVDYHAWQASTGTGSQSYGLSTPTGMTYVTVAIEVQASGGASPAYPPSRQARRRTAAPRLPHTGARIATPVRAQVNPPFPLNGIRQPKAFRGRLPRRGESFMPVPAQVVIAPPAYPVRPARIRVKGLRLFRGRAASPVPAQVVVAAPAYPVQPVRPRLRGLRAFRAHIAAPPVGQPSATQALRVRLRVPRIFRGRPVAPVPAQVVVAAPSYPPQSVRVRLRGLRIGRGRVAVPVPAQVVVVPPAYPSQSVRVRVRGLRLFRGRAAAPVPPQASVVAPTFVPLPTRPRLKWLRQARGRAAAPVADQPSAAAAPRPRTHGMAPRRGRAVTPVPPQAAVAAPAYPLQSVREKVRGLKLGRARTASPVPAQAAAVAPARAPQPVRARVRSILGRRGRSKTPYANTVTPVNPSAPPPVIRSTTRPELSVTGRARSLITNARDRLLRRDTRGD